MGYEVVQLEGNSMWEDEQGVRRPVIQSHYKCDDLAEAVCELRVRKTEAEITDDQTGGFSILYDGGELSDDDKAMRDQYDPEDEVVFSRLLEMGYQEHDILTALGSKEE